MALIELSEASLVTRKGTYAHRSLNVAKLGYTITIESFRKDIDLSEFTDMKPRWYRFSVESNGREKYRCAFAQLFDFEKVVKLSKYLATIQEINYAEIEGHRN